MESNLADTNITLYKKTELTFFFFFLLIRATPATYGGSQVRGQIGAIAASLHHRHSTAGYDLHHSSWQHQILNP